MIKNGRSIAPEEFYQALLNNIEIGITLIDSDHKIVMANAAIGKMFNRNPKEFIGKYCFAEYEKRNAICQHCPGVKAMADGKMHTVETEGVCEDGTRFFVRNHAVPFFGKDSRSQGFIEIIEDITARKKMEEKVKESVEEWQKTFDSIADLIFIQNTDHVILRVNKAFAEVLKAKPEEIVGKKCYELLHKTNSPWPDCPFERTKKDKATHIQEVDDVNIGIPLLVTTSPILNDRGELAGAVHIAKNITFIKDKEKELAKKIHDLETFHKVAVGRELKMEELRKRIRELEAKLGQREEHE